tara:strand:- start:2263 stop:2862 length:600 start_codon:yes stop_codon:yes gene_type:complete
MLDANNILIITIGIISSIALFNTIKKINTKIDIYGEIKDIDYKNDVFVFLFLQGSLLLFSLNTSNEIKTISRSISNTNKINTEVVTTEYESLKRTIYMTIVYFIFLFTLWFLLKFFGYNTHIIKTAADNDIVIKKKKSFVGEIIVASIAALSVIFAIFHIQNPGKVKEMTKFPYEFTSFVSLMVMPIIVVIILLENTDI